MTALTENIVLSRTRAQDLKSVRKLNCWGSELTDVSIVRKMPYVEVLSLSVNNITTLADFAYCKCLQELYIRKNKIKDLNEVCHLQNLPNLRHLWLADNPCAESDCYRLTVLRTLPQLQKLDNVAVSVEELNRARVQGLPLTHPHEVVNDDSPSKEGSPQMAPPSLENPRDKREIVQQQDQEKLVSTTEKKCETPRSDIAQDDRLLDSPPQEYPVNRPAEKDLILETIEVKHREPSTNSRSALEARHSLPLAHDDPRQLLSPSSSQSSLPSASEYSQQQISPVQQQQHHLHHAFHARVQTLVDHSGRGIKKSVEVNCDNPVCSLYQEGQQMNEGIRYRRLEESCSSSDLKQLAASDYEETSSVNGYHCSHQDTADMYRHYSHDSMMGSSDYRSGGASGMILPQRSDKNSPTRILPKGGKNRNANILSAVLCLIKELDYASLEVVETAIHCRMEEMDD